MSQPVDATTTIAWERLIDLHEEFTPNLRGWFASDPQRAEDLTFTAGDLYVDLSKNLLNGAVLHALVDLAREVGLEHRRDAMLAASTSRHRDRALLQPAAATPGRA